jgi:NADH:ubiquinone oxidoreductase subunit D
VDAPGEFGCFVVSDGGEPGQAPARPSFFHLAARGCSGAGKVGDVVTSGSIDIVLGR